jgi:hypothetical protein
VSSPETLLRCYPRAWRDRYGEEFAALLADDIAERPRCLRRDLDVVRCGLTARLATPATALAALLVFVAAATSIWTQLARGTLGARPDTTAVTLGLVTLTVCGLAVAAVALTGTALLLAATVRTVRRQGGRPLVRPALTALAGAVTLAAGAVHIAAHAHASAPVVRWTWAATEAISTYWVHPGRLLGLPPSELAWMAASPIAAAACWRGLAGLAHHTGLTSTWQRLARPLIAAVLTPALVAAATWVVGSQRDPNASLRAGSLDLALIAAMTAAVLTIDAAAGRRESSLA